VEKHALRRCRHITNDKDVLQAKWKYYELRGGI
jgi:hypothetical protein